jgi:Tfp pilus assembly protein PilX
MMLGVMMVLAVLATTAVAVTVNTQQSTADTRTQMTAFDYAQAALRSGLLAATTKTWPAVNGSFSQSDLTAAYSAAYPSGPPATIQVYDNQGAVDTAVTWDKGSPASASVPDGKLWVQASVTYNGQTAVVRQEVGQVNATQPITLPAAAIYTDANIAVGPNGSGNVYAINADGTPDVTGSVGAIAQGNFVGNWSSNLKPPSGASAPTITVQVNGTAYNPAVYGNTTTYSSSSKPAPPDTTFGGVVPMETFFGTAQVNTLTTQAQAGNPTQANPNGTVVSSALLTQLQSTSPQTYTASTDLVVNGNLTLGGGPSTFKFRSLYVTGNLTLGGNTHTDATALYVGGDFTISGPSDSNGGPSQFGPIYVGGNVNWGGALSVKTTNYTDASAPAGPLYVAKNFVTQGGPFNHVLGPTYVGGNVTIAGNQALFLCPLLVTPGVITTSGSAAIGTVANPILMLDNGTTQDIDLGSNGTFTGLMVNMYGGVTLPGGNGSKNDIIGAIYAKGTVTFGGNTGLCYNPAVLANAASGLQSEIGTTETSVIPGTWQELSPSGQ